METYKNPDDDVKLSATAFKNMRGGVTFEVTYAGYLYAYVDIKTTGFNVQLNDPYTAKYTNNFRKTLVGAQLLLNRHLKSQLGFTVEIILEVEEASDETISLKMVEKWK